MRRLRVGWHRLDGGAPKPVVSCKRAWPLCILTYTSPPHRYEELVPFYMSSLMLKMGEDDLAQL